MSYSVKLINKFSSFVDKSDTKRLSTQTEPEDVVKVKNIVYAGDGSDIYRLLDVYYPEGAKGKLPVIIDIHGGAWFYGTKDINRIYAQKIAREGFAVVNMSYRLLFNGGNIHTMVEDVFGVFNWIKQNEDNYPFDLKNVFLTGDSAGAHIACLALSVMADEELQKTFNVTVPFEINAAGLTCGVYDIEFFMKKMNLSPIRAMMKGFFGKDYKKSPLLKIGTIKNNKVENFPPIHLSTGRKDFKRSQVLAFSKVLAERGVEHELIDFNPKDADYKLTHVYSVLFPDRKESKITTQSMLDFFREHMRES